MTKLYAIGGLFFAVLILGLLLWFYKKGVTGATQAAVVAAGDIATGAVKGIGETVGIPDTSRDQCALDQAAGDYWNASFSCSAGVFLKDVWNRSFSTEPLTGTDAP